MVELPLDALIRLFKLASLGKLIGGLIHNLNGPLQNLGLDIEMAGYTLKNDPGLKKTTTEDIHSRLKRMEEEFERINRMIKTVSAKATPDDGGNNAVVNLNDYLHQELYFLESNLYFKHNVNTELKFQDDAPLPCKLPKNSLIALSWFLQALVEELENEEIKGLTLKTSSADSLIKIKITTRGGNLSKKFIGRLNQKLPSSKSLKAEDSDLGMLLILMIFKEGGASLKVGASGGPNITIEFPTQDEGG